MKKTLRSEYPPAFERKTYTNPEMNPFLDFIIEKYFVKKLKGSRVLNDLRSKGCKVSSSAFIGTFKSIRRNLHGLICDMRQSSWNKDNSIRRHTP